MLFLKQVMSIEDPIKILCLINSSIRVGRSLIKLIIMLIPKVELNTILM